MMTANRKAQLAHIAEHTAHLALQKITGAPPAGVLVLDKTILSDDERASILQRIAERGLSPLVVLGPLELAEV